MNATAFLRPIVEQMITIRGVTRRLSKQMLVACSIATVAFASAAQTYPARAVTIVVPFSAGGPSDILARLLGRQLSQAWGQPVIVENRAGATGMIGSALVVRAQPDGQTLLMGSTSSHVAPYLYGQPSYDPQKDLSPVINVATMPLYLVVNPSFPGSSFPEFLAELKRRPSTYSYSSAGSGAVNHLAMELLKSTTKVDAVHVPYKGAAPAMQAVMSGEVAFSFDTISQADVQVQAGKLRGIAVTGSRRSPAVPKLPTVAESGVASFTPMIWFGLFAPAATSRAVIDKLNADVTTAMSSPDIQSRLTSLGAEFSAETATQFQKRVAAETLVWKKLIQDIGAKAD